jgi:hypothetical protein
LQPGNGQSGQGKPNRDSAIRRQQPEHPSVKPQKLHLDRHPYAEAIIGEESLRLKPKGERLISWA